MTFNILEALYCTPFKAKVSVLNAVLGHLAMSLIESTWLRHVILMQLVTSSENQHTYITNTCTKSDNLV